MISQVDQKRMFNKLKHDLEPWRNLLVQLDSVLKWEKPYYPAALFGVVTLFYLILWELNLSIITLLALAGLTVLAFDFGYPMVARLVFKQENWSGAQEASYEHICEQICSAKMAFQACFDFWFGSQEHKSAVIVIMVSGLLLLLAWVGAAFDNLLLMYFVTVSVVLMPGIMQNSVVENFLNKMCSLIKSQAQQLRQRAGHAKAE